MAAHCFDHLEGDHAFISRLRNTFLIRDPAKTIASDYALNPGVSLAETGCEQLCRVYRIVQKMNGCTPVAVDADDLEDDPPILMAAYCDRLGLEFMPQALSWSPQASDKWKIWEQWHRDAARSAGIVKNLETFETTIDNSTLLRAYYDHHLPFYRQMYRDRIHP